MPKQLINAILKTIILIPGIYGLANVDFSKSNLPLKEADWHKALKIEIDEQNHFCQLTVAIIVRRDIQTKIIAVELDSSLQNFLKRDGVILKDLNIYVRGIK